MGAQLLHLFDFYWFQHLMFSNSQSSPHPDLKFHDPFKEYSSLFHLLSLRAVIFLSDDEQFLSSQESFISDDSLSPISALQASKLQRMFSGEEIGEGYLTFDENDRRRRRGSRKRMSELEMEEVKGFMDMGFVFSEEDKNSWLVSLVPGVKRLGREDNDHGEEEEEEEEEGEDVEKCEVSRPYLSEAWGVMDGRRRRRKGMDKLMNWRIPDSANEMDMKDHLRLWAHTVASAVR